MSYDMVTKNFAVRISNIVAKYFQGANKSIFVKNAFRPTSGNTIFNNRLALSVFHFTSITLQFRFIFAYWQKSRFFCHFACLFLACSVGIIVGMNIFFELKSVWMNQKPQMNRSLSRRSNSGLRDAIDLVGLQSMQCEVQNHHHLHHLSTQFRLDNNQNICIINMPRIDLHERLPN